MKNPISSKQIIRKLILLQNLISSSHQEKSESQSMQKNIWKGGMILSKTCKWSKILQFTIINLANGKQPIDLELKLTTCLLGLGLQVYIPF